MPRQYAARLLGPNSSLSVRWSADGPAVSECLVLLRVLLGLGLPEFDLLTGLKLRGWRSTASGWYLWNLYLWRICFRHADLPCPLLCCCSGPSGTAPVQVCVGSAFPPFYPPSISLCVRACTLSCAGGRSSIPACHSVACLELSGQQTQAVSNREGFSARVQQVGVWCRCVAFFWPVLPHFPSVLLCSQPRFPACSCQLSCSFSHLESGPAVSIIQILRGCFQWLE